jgi:uncharacterized protein
MKIPSHLRSLKPGMAERLGYYVYLYVDPRDGKVFYIGKGKGERCLDHLFEDDDHPKVKRIQEIFAVGLEPRIEMLAHGLRTEQEAYNIESAAIGLLGLENLTNRVVGKDSLRFGWKGLSELEGYYAAKPVKITDPVILIRVNQLYRHGMSAAELYDITRGVWKMDLERASFMKYVFAVYEGVVREVYEVEKWQSAQIGSYATRKDLVPEDGNGRKEFVGKLAPEAIRQKYLLGDVSAYTKVSLQQPCLYINEP